MSAYAIDLDFISSSILLIISTDLLTKLIHSPTQEGSLVESDSLIDPIETPSNDSSFPFPALDRTRIRSCVCAKVRSLSGTFSKLSRVEAISGTVGWRRSETTRADSSETAMSCMSASIFTFPATRAPP